jgi:hypothetical protein
LCRPAICTKIPASKGAFVVTENGSASHVGRRRRWRMTPGNANHVSFPVK